MLSQPSVQSASERTARTAQNPPTPSWRKVNDIVLFIFVSLVAATAIRLGVAGYLVQLAQQDIDNWAPQTISRPTTAEVKRVSALYSDSLGYVADNPWALEGAGSMDLAHMRRTTVPSEALAAAQDARLRFRRALQQRPTSAFLWANLALSKLYLDQRDDELMSALRRADELGPWEQSIQQTVVFVGLAVWQQLDPSMRSLITKTIRRGAVTSPRRMYEIAKSYARFDLVCAIQQFKAIPARECGNAAQLVKPGRREGRR